METFLPSAPNSIAASIALLFVASVPVFGQKTVAGTPHVIVVKLVTKGGSVPYVFEPANIKAQRGDTLRFVTDGAAPHNVHFKTHPSGANLGAAASGPYLTTKGQAYNVVIDARFTDGKYDYVCDPHEMLGMRGTLIVGKKAAVDKSTK